MNEWVATREELAVDHYYMETAHNMFAPVECNHRIAFHDGTQDAVKIMTPAPRFMAALMAGGCVRAKRWVRDDTETGRPVFEGRNEFLPALTYEQAVEFVAWRDMPRGCNNWRIIHTDELPRIAGDVDRARMFRAAWRLKEAA